MNFVLLLYGINQHVMNCFNKKIGHALTEAQLKNKWDGIKKDWRI